MNGRYERTLKFHFVTVLEETLNYVFEQKDYEALNKLNEINAHINENVIKSGKTKLPIITDEQIHEKKLIQVKKKAK